MNENEARTTEEAEEAKRWVEGMKQPDGSLVRVSLSERHCFVSWYTKGEVSIEGLFSAAKLRALVDYMEQHSKDGSTTTHAGKEKE